MSNSSVLPDFVSIFTFFSPFQVEFLSNTMKSTSKYQQNVYSHQDILPCRCTLSHNPRLVFSSILTLVFESFRRFFNRSKISCDWDPTSRHQYKILCVLSCSFQHDSSKVVLLAFFSVFCLCVCVCLFRKRSSFWFGLEKNGRFLEEFDSSHLERVVKITTNTPAP